MGTMEVVILAFCAGLCAGFSGLALYAGWLMRDEEDE